MTRFSWGLLGFVIATSCIPHGKVRKEDESSSGGAANLGGASGAGTQEGHEKSGGKGGQNDAGLGGDLSLGGTTPSSGGREGTGGSAGAETGGSGGSGGNAMGLGGAPVLFSDTFDGALDPKWTFVDPLGDCTLTMTGTTAEIHIPEGTPHDLWHDAISSPHLIQDAPDTDFELIAVFNSRPTEHVQGQGILAKQDQDTLIRVDHYFASGYEKIFFAFIDGENEPVVFKDWTVFPEGPITHLRLRRSGIRWTVDYSEDGNTYSASNYGDQEMTVNHVGVYGLNYVDNPETTVIIEEFISVP